ncbi:MAG: NADH-quinone oxidoreductase subunit M [Alphaproteobacteria bacterium]|nr:NADH-quinone oxidoreductase subunit M [Alphaproteobacteria bacterium]
MANLPLISFTIFLPLLGCLFIFMIQGESPAAIFNTRAVAFLTSLANLGLSFLLFLNFNFENPFFQMEEKHAWISQYNIFYHVGIDGISLPFILLTAFLIPIALLSSWSSITQRVKEYMVCFLVLETLLIGMFAALDLITFYLFFEGVLIPMFMIIGIWGGDRRIYATYKFFLYTLFGSLFMLAAIMVLYTKAGTTDLPIIFENLVLETSIQQWLWWGFFISFAVKIPMWPVHTWLPDAHVEAPTAGSVILAGVLLKMGGYGLIRFSLPLFGFASSFFSPVIYSLSVIAIIYTSLVALSQNDMKRLIAYSSVAHMGVVTLGLFTFSLQGLQGGLFQMISHGLISAALFLCVGVVYDRQHTRMIGAYGGLAQRMPIYAVAFAIFTLAAVALPGTSGFVGEVLVLIAAYQIKWYWAFAASMGMILSAAYMLWLYRRVFFGKLTLESIKQIQDLSLTEKLIFLPLILLIFWLGIYPSSLLRLTEPSVKHTLKTYQKSLHAKKSLGA